MTDVIRAFRPDDPFARSINPSAFRQRSTNGCWLRPPKPAPAPPPPPDCQRPRCDEPAATDGWCDRHAVEEREWLAVDVEQIRRDKEQRMGYRL